MGACVCVAAACSTVFPSSQRHLTVPGIHVRDMHRDSLPLRKQPAAITAKPALSVFFPFIFFFTFIVVAFTFAPRRFPLSPAIIHHNLTSGAPSPILLRIHFESHKSSRWRPPRVLLSPAVASSSLVRNLLPENSSPCRASRTNASHSYMAVNGRFTNPTLKTACIFRCRRADADSRSIRKLSSCTPTETTQSSTPIQPAARLQRLLPTAMDLHRWWPSRTL